MPFFTISSNWSFTGDLYACGMVRAVWTAKGFASGRSCISIGLQAIAGNSVDWWCVKVIRKLYQQLLLAVLDFFCRRIFTPLYFARAFKWLILCGSGGLCLCRRQNCTVVWPFQWRSWSPFRLDRDRTGAGYPFIYMQYAVVPQLGIWEQVSYLCLSKTAKCATISVGDY